MAWQGFLLPQVQASSEMFVILQPLAWF